LSNRKALVLTGGLTFLVLVVASFPARIATQWFLPADVRLGGVSGSIWNGSASEVAFGEEYFSNLHWSLKPAQLFLGRVALDADLVTLAGPLKTSVALGLGGTVTLNALSGSLSVAGLHPALESNRIGGQLHLQLDEVVLDGGRLQAASGRVAVDRLRIGSLGSGELGRFVADIDTRGDDIVADVQDDEAVVDLAGSFVVTLGRNYLFTGTIAPNGRTPQSINDNLRFLGSPDADGQRPFRFEGAL